MGALDKKAADVLAYNLHGILKDNKSVVDCDDSQCDNEDCVMYRALEQYMKYAFEEENAVSISFEFEINDGEAKSQFVNHKMKASELIKILKHCIVQVGDVEVVCNGYDDMEGNYPLQIDEVSMEVIQETINEVSYKLDDIYASKDTYPSEWIKVYRTVLLIK